MNWFFVVGSMWEQCCDCGSGNISEVRRDVCGVIITGGQCQECGAEHYQEGEFLIILAQSTMMLGDDDE